jgi:hypothetical protein
MSTDHSSSESEIKPVRIPVPAGMAIHLLEDLLNSGLRIPGNWWKNIRMLKSGKADLIGIIVLASVVRKSFRRRKDIKTSIGWVETYEDGFEEDMHELNYGIIADRVGRSKREVQNACHRLRDQGLIRMELRHVTDPKTGRVHYNCVFVAPVPEAVVSVTLNDPEQLKAKKAAGSAGTAPVQS